MSLDSKIIQKNQFTYTDTNTQADHYSDPYASPYSDPYVSTYSDLYSESSVTDDSLSLSDETYFEGIETDTYEANLNEAQSDYQSLENGEQTISLIPEILEKQIDDLEDFMRKNHDVLSRNLNKIFKKELKEINNFLKRNSEDMSILNNLKDQLDEIDFILLDASMANQKEQESLAFDQIKSLKKKLEDSIHMSAEQKSELQNWLTAFEQTLEKEPFHAEDILSDLERVAQDIDNALNEKFSGNSRPDDIQGTKGIYKSQSDLSFILNPDSEIKTHEIYASGNILIQSLSESDTAEVSQKGDVITVQTMGNTFIIHTEETTLVELDFNGSKVSGDLDNVNIGANNSKAPAKLGPNIELFLEKLNGVSEEQFLEKVKEIYPHFDKNDDGVITKKELAEANFPPEDPKDAKLMKLLVALDSKLEEDLKQFHVLNRPANDSYRLSIRDKVLGFLQVLYPEKSIVATRPYGNYDVSQFYDDITIEGQNYDILDARVMSVVQNNGDYSLYLNFDSLNKGGW